MMLSRAFLIIIAICGLTISALIFGLRRFRSLGNLVVVQKRYPVMVQLECGACILYILIAVPMWALFTFSESSVNLSESAQFGLTLSARIFNMTLVHMIINFEASRLWLVCFDLHYLHASKNQKWKVLINPIEGSKDWYLAHRRTWG